MILIYSLIRLIGLSENAIEKNYFLNTKSKILKCLNSITK